MSKSKLARWILFGVLVMVMSSSAVLAQEVIYVGPDEEYDSITEGIMKAVDFKERNIASEVVIRSGVYREFVNIDAYTNFPSNDPGNRTPILVRGEGDVQIKGSDIFTDWSLQSNGLWTHVWEHNWGKTQIAEPDEAVLPADIVRRREVIFIDGKRLHQAMSRHDMPDESFFVDEQYNRLYLKTGRTLSNHTVEVAVREELYEQQHLSDVTLRNITFMHAANRWKNSTGAVAVFGGAGLNLRDITITENNGRGLYVTEAEDVSLEAVVLNDNGWDGWGFWKVKNLTVLRSETSRNNWRGHLGGYYVWRVGNKILKVHGLVLRDHLAEDNFSHGIWLDLDNKDVLLDRVIIRNNLKSGIYIEANQGPIKITDSQIRGNDEHAVLVANSEKLTIEYSRFDDNGEDWLFISGASSGRTITDFETLSRIELYSRDYTIRENRIEVESEEGWVINNGLTADSFRRFYESLKSYKNNYFATTQRTFKVSYNDHLTLSEWQELTGEDYSSQLAIVGNALPGESDDLAAPKELGLDAGYPNPFSLSTSIPYRLPSPAHLSIALYDVQGRRVADLHNGLQSAGHHEVSVSAAGLAAGTYLVRMVVDGKTLTAPLTLAR